MRPVRGNRNQTKPNDTDMSARTRTQGTPAPATGGWIKTGGAARAALEKAEKEAAERRERGFMPLRFWLPQGEECEVIILDDAFVADEPGKGGALIREHNLKDSEGKWGNFESCCADFAPCALCDKAGSDGFGVSTTVVMLTALVLKPWKSKKTGEEHAYSRMLLPVKLGQKEKFLELQRHAEREQGTMRGLYLVLKRGTGDQTVATGEPVMLDNGKLYDLVSEEELVRDYGHPPVKNREGKVIKEANADLEPYDYEELFPRPDPDDLAARFGGRPVAGSRRNAAAEWDNEQGTAVPEAAQGEPPPARRRGAAQPAPAETPPPSRRRGSAPAQQEAAPPPSRRRGASSAQQAPADGAPW